MIKASSTEGGDIDRETLRIDDAERASRKAFVGFTASDAELLGSLAPTVELHADAIVDAFYTNIARYPELQSVIDGAGSNIERLKAAQRRYLLDMFSGEYGEAYFDRRLKIGAVHNRIGLTPRWYIGSYSVYWHALQPLILRATRLSPGRRARLLMAVNRIIAIDTQLAMDTYIHGLVVDLQGLSLSKGEIEDRIERFAGFIGAVAEGDLTRSLEVDAKDDIGTLGRDLERMRSGLRDLAQDGKAAATRMSGVVERMQAAVARQSSGVNQQAAAISETTATLAEMRATSTQTLEKAAALGDMAGRTLEGSQDGVVAMDQAVAAMGEIRVQMDGIAQAIQVLSQQTRQIGEITDRVSRLAKQSRMLALNASIEAAKAGEAGRGFAVVAAAVRDLAELSQESTEQVQQVLDDIQRATDRAVDATGQGRRQVDLGAQLIDRSGALIRELGGLSEDAAMASDQIVAAVRQEVVGIEQVSQAMTEIAEVTTSLVDSASATSEVASELEEVARGLNQNVGRYRVR